MVLRWIEIETILWHYFADQRVVYKFLNWSFASIISESYFLTLHRVVGELDSKRIYREENNLYC